MEVRQVCVLTMSHNCFYKKNWYLETPYYKSWAQHKKYFTDRVIIKKLVKEAVQTLLQNDKKE